MLSTTGFVEVPEGKLFWNHDTCTHPDRSQPFLIFLHAAVADHTLWDEQVRQLAPDGCQCLTYDRLGYGQSTLSKAYLQSDDRPPIQHYEHPEKLIVALETQLCFTNRKCVVIGLSMGACTALDFALAYPSRIAGVMLCSGAAGGFEEPEPKSLDRELFESYEGFIQKARKESDPEADLICAANVQVRIWGDGLQAEKGRLQNASVRDRLFAWCKDIAAKEALKIGGFALPSSELSDPPAAERLKSLPPEMKVRVAIGKYDEIGTIEAMKYVQNEVNVKRGVRNAGMREFDAAHMCNMETPDEFNEWVKEFLGVVSGESEEAEQAEQRRIESIET